MSKFSHRLKESRSANKLSRELLANKLGVSYSTIAKYESGDREPDFSTLKKLSYILEVPVNYLIGEDETSNNFDPMLEINKRLKEYGIEQSGFFDRERWKVIGLEEIKELDNYFKYITDQAKKKKNNNLK